MLYTILPVPKRLSSLLYKLFRLLCPTVRSPYESSPNVDLLSYVFENQTDDEDRPVRVGSIRYGTLLTLQGLDRCF